MQMNSAQRYINEIKRLIEAVENTQKENIEKAATFIADALSNGGYIFTFGTGHSHILAEEIFYRAGGLVRVCPILEDSLMLHRAAAASSQLERVTGLASVLLDDVAPGEPCSSAGYDGGPDAPFQDPGPRHSDLRGVFFCPVRRTETGHAETRRH